LKLPVSHHRALLPIKDCARKLALAEAAVGEHMKMPGPVRFVVAHDNGNPGSTAAGNVKYYENSRNEKSASAHLFVDDQEILECIPALTGPPAPDRIHAFVEGLFANDLHARRVASLAGATLGAVNAASLSIHAIGRGLAAAQGLDDKHAIKQVDRCIGNAGIDVEALAPAWVRDQTAGRRDLVVHLDWTEFEPDDHSMIVLSLQTSHGRSVPLLWKTVLRSQLKNRRNDHADELLVRFRAMVPIDVRVTVVADRGFSDQKLFDFLGDEIGFDFIIRFRDIVHVTSKDGETRAARDWIPGRGRTRVMRDARVTADRCLVGMVLLAHDKDMDEPWCLAVGLEIVCRPDGYHGHDPSGPPYAPMSFRLPFQSLKLVAGLPESTSGLPGSRWRSSFPPSPSSPNATKPAPTLRFPSVPVKSVVPS
jgi:hypothetical protein